MTTPAVAPSGPEQLPLLRMLEVVCERVESIHAGQKALTAEVRDIKLNLPMQRKPASKRTEEIHIRATWARRNGMCPNCQEIPVVTATGRLRRIRGRPLAQPQCCEGHSGMDCLPCL